jgi:predicted Zn-dependent protease
MAKSHQLRIELLEDRCVPAILGVPWTDPTHLTLSFVPDGTQIAAHGSNLFSTLDGQMSRDHWQRAILRAIQTWEKYANIDVGVVADSGLPFGTPGLTQGDPRFGDIRIGAQAMSLETISVSVPHDPFLSGTWSGDVLFNSQYNFTNPNYDLYSVALHEFGHVFGLGDSTDPDSAMYPQLTFRHLDLAASDVTNIRSLYGTRAFDPINNQTLRTASPIPYPPNVPNYLGATPLTVFADLWRRSIVDVYSVVTIPNYHGSVSFRVVTAGISLMEPEVTVYDASGGIIGMSAGTSALGNIVTVTIPQVTPNTLYYVKVKGAVKDDFSIGRYALAVTFNANLKVPLDSVDGVLRGPYDSLPGTNVEDVFDNPTGVQFNEDDASTTPETARVLSTTRGYRRASRYDFVASLSEETGINFFQVQAPGNGSSPPAIMTLAVNMLSVHGFLPHVDILDSHQNVVATNVLVDGNGSLVIQAINLTPGAVYYLRATASGTPDQQEQGGNFSLDVDFLLPGQLFTDFGGGTVSDSSPQLSGSLYVADTQLFQFSLAADAIGLKATASVRMRIFDSSGNTLFDLTASAGSTETGTGLFLTPGGYTIQFDLITSSGGPLGGPLSFHLYGATIDDPIGPALNDPTLNPTYRCPNDPSMYCYPNGRMTSNPFLIVLL